MEIQINYPWTDEEKANIREGITKLVNSVRPATSARFTQTHTHST